MYPHLPNRPPETDRAALARACAEGDHAAGVKLVEKMWEAGPVTVDTVMRVARSAGVLTPAAFDLLYDAFEDASLARYKREHGIKDPPAPVESD